MSAELERHEWLVAKGWAGRAIPVDVINDFRALEAQCEKQMARTEKAEVERDEIDRSRKRFMDGIAAFQSMTGFDLENGARRLLQLSESEARAEKAEAALAEIDGRAVHAAWRDGMIAQGRIVERDLMAWDNLRDVDRSLDETIAQPLKRAAGRESGGTKLEVSPAGNWERKP